MTKKATKTKNVESKEAKTNSKAVVVIAKAEPTPPQAPIVEAKVITPEQEASRQETAELKAAIATQTNAMGVIITGSTNGKLQQRVIGPRLYRNQFGHYYGTIGSKIDKLIQNGAFTKRQIEAYAGTKMSKVNSHIAHLRRDCKKVILIDEKTKKVRFA